MIYTLKTPVLNSCEDWAKELGVAVKQVITHPDGTIEIETIEKTLVTGTKNKLESLTGLKVQ